MEIKRMQASFIQSPSTNRQSAPSSPYLTSPPSFHHKHSPAAALSSQHSTPSASLSPHAGQPLGEARKGGREEGGREGGKVGGREGRREGEKGREGGRNG